MGSPSIAPGAPSISTAPAAGRARATCRAMLSSIRTSPPRGSSWERATWASTCTRQGLTYGAFTPFREKSARDGSVCRNVQPRQATGPLLRQTWIEFAFAKVLKPFYGAQSDVGQTPAMRSRANQISGQTSSCRWQQSNRGCTSDQLVKTPSCTTV